MKCPYPDCSGKAPRVEAELCRTCARPVKRCPKCRAAARAFARFCAACGKPLPGGAFDWSGYRGGPRRLGLNPSRAGHSWRKAKLEKVDPGSILLEEECFGLLSHDHYLIAVGSAGRVVLRAPGSSVHLGFQADGRPTCQPCIEQGMLFLGRSGAIDAYALGALTLPEPATSPVWTVPLPGEPHGALLALGNHLFVNVAEGGRPSGVMVIESVFDRRPPRARWIHQGAKVSVLAGDRNSAKAHFLAENDGKIELHSLDTTQSGLPVEIFPFHDLAGKTLGRTPVAVMGKNLFAVLGPDDQLCRLQAGKPSVRLDDDVKRFCLNSFDQRVLLRTPGLSFPGGQQVELTHMERVVVPPVLMRDFALAVGLQDGRILIYDSNHPPFHRDEKPDGHAITSLASFGPYLAAGTSRGTVALYRVVPI
ncbi:MAG: hypothetical protein MI919_02360 [Holophagales bacterium]|nr:hypothetical protein [Holophagales bacterium]